MSRIIILGGGMVGSAMAIDMATKHEVTLADRSEDVLKKVKQRCDALAVQQLDVTNKLQLQNAIKTHNLVMCAVPGFLGFETLKSVIEAGKDVVDISFFPENALELDILAKEKNVTVIVDCGVAPGMGNVILGYHNEKMKVSDFECLVGGLPKVRKWPFSYKAPFSPVDVIEEYTRPARYVEHGQVVVRQALSDCELVDFEIPGTLESFNSDGLRSLIYTMPHIPNMKEKTLRYPGHAEYIRVLKESGFFNSDKININGVGVSPLEFTSKILFDEWRLAEGEEELTLMRITIKGEDPTGQKEQITYQLYDEYDPQTRTSSMARTTGYTATAAANMILDDFFAEKGVFPPELVGKYDACFDYILKYLEERGVRYEKTVSLQ
jgi:saccharopine dehydrogenase-like NADP-dependent oxidoreductase